MLYVNNDEGLQGDAREALCVSDNSDFPRLATLLKEWTESLFSPLEFEFRFGEPMGLDMQAILYDIGSIWRINWTECVEALMEDA
jgi:hypothetical protein